jgi:hypothetical protein
MTSMKRRIACFCESTFEADMPSAADLATDPEVEQSILDGDFMSVTCPACGKRLTPEFPFRLKGVKGLGEILLVPEPDRAALARGKLQTITGSEGRVVAGFPELVEKLIIAAAGLDDRVIEIMKYYLLTGGASHGALEGHDDVTVLYRGLDGGKHLFHIVGMKKGEVGVARLPPDLYSRIAADVETRILEEPFRDFCTPPWVSLRRVSGSRS